jgi:dephospho-CoA kinase
MVLKGVPWCKGQALHELIDLCGMGDFSTSSRDLLPVVGLTGGIGSGKTTVAGIFETIGIPVYNADERAKTLYRRDAALRTWVVNRFGDRCGILKNGLLVDINSNELAEIVFSDSNALVELNEAVHPAVHRDFGTWHVHQSQHSNAPYAIREAAILIESGSHKGCDKVIAVHAPKSLRLDRAAQRMNANPAHIEKRMNQQLSDEARGKYSDFIIENAEDNHLLHQVLELHASLVAVYTPEDGKTP